MQVCRYFYSNIPPIRRAFRSLFVGWGVFDMTKLSKVT